MNIKNKPATFFAILILLFMAFILYWSSTKPVSVVIQTGHKSRTSGKSGVEWNILVADEVTKTLRSWQIDVKRIPAKVHFTKAKIAVSIHFDEAGTPCNSGASIGYPNRDSYAFAQRWKALYRNYFPYKWHKDNFTSNLKNYYAYKWIHADKFLLLELGEITCDKQTKWLKPRLKKIAHLVAYAIATELGKKVKRPKL